MSWFDLCALLLVALAVFDGAKNGIAWSALELALLTAVAVAARLLGPRLEPYVAKVADLAPEDDLHAVAHLTVFALLAVLAAGVLILLHPASKRWRFPQDKWLGALIGACFGLFASILLFSVVIWAKPRPGLEDTIAESRLLSVLRAAESHGLAGTLPEHTAPRLAQLERP